MSTCKSPPEFKSKLKSYDRYERVVWLPILKKKKQGIAVALSLPENDLSGVRDKVLNLHYLTLIMMKVSLH